MCLGVPGRISEILEGGLMRMGLVDFDGVSQEICLAYVPDAEPGDHVLVHAGFALAELSEEDAQKTLEVLAQLGEPPTPQPPEDGPGS